MRVYKVHWEDPTLGMLLMWTATHARAKQLLAENKAAIAKAYPGLGREYEKGYNSGIELVDVPTTRKALIDWLNEHCTEDNG